MNKNAYFKMMGLRKRAAQPFVEQQSADYYDSLQDPEYKAMLFNGRAVSPKYWQKGKFVNSMLGSIPPNKSLGRYADDLDRAVYTNKNFKPLIDVNKAKRNQQQRLKNPSYLWNTAKDFWSQPLQNLGRLFR